jgi:serine/threonine-protein kinase
LKLLDFGISKLLKGHTGDGSSGSGKIIGTPAYMAPEAALGRELTDRADVYAVGVILFRALTAAFPFDDASTRDLLLNQVTLQAPDVRDLRAGTPPELAEIVARCLSQQPEGRPSARELARVLGAFADASGAPTLETLAQRRSTRLRARPTEDAATVAEGRRTP